MTALLLVLVSPAMAAAAANELDVDAIAARMSPRLADRTGWARDLAAAFDVLGRRKDPASICTALAIVAVNTDFETDRRLRHLAHYDFRVLLRRKLGGTGAVLAEHLLRLSGASAGPDFFTRFESARTEGEIDRAYHDLVLDWGRRSPLLVGLVEVAGRTFAGAGLADLDPVSTLGPMQVSVRWAARRTGSEVADTELRKMLASRRGGLLMGVARLFATSDRYDDAAFQIADYNAGPFTSRNAAFERQITELTGVDLPLDGDLLAYRPDGSARGSSRTLDALGTWLARQGRRGAAAQIRRDLAVEKSAELERTATWNEVRDAWRRRFGRQPGFALLPEIRYMSLHETHATTVRGYVGQVLSRRSACLEAGEVAQRSARGAGLARSGSGDEERRDRG